MEYRAAVFIGRGSPVAAELSDAANLAEPDAIAWVQIRPNEDTDLKALATLFGLPEDQLRRYADPYDRQKVIEYGPWASMSLIRVDASLQEEHFDEVGVYIGAKTLITLAEPNCEVTDAWFDRWYSRPQSMGPSPAAIASVVMDDAIDHYFPVIDHIEDSVEDLEERVFDSREFSVPEALRVKRRLLAVRRAIAPTRDGLNALLRRDAPGFNHSVRAQLQDVYDHTLRLIERCDVNRELMADVLDGHQNVVANQMNIVMKTLTVIATILMSISLISGIYGMNFDFMPETQQPLGYPVCLLIMVLVAYGEWRVFRKKGWI